MQVEQSASRRGCTHHLRDGMILCASDDRTSDAAGTVLGVLRTLQRPCIQWTGQTPVKSDDANGPTCTPGSVPGFFAPSTAISLGDTLPWHSSGLPEDSASRVNILCLTLLRTRFTWRAMSPWPPVVSYTTLSPLPLTGRSTLCGTFSRIAPGGRYPPSCPEEPGRSSVRSPATRPSSRPIRTPSLLLGRPFLTSRRTPRSGGPGARRSGTSRRAGSSRPRPLHARPRPPLLRAPAERAR